MGLNAVVYVNVDYLAFDVSGPEWRIDQLTGEVYSEDLNVCRGFPKETFVARQVMLGNISLVSYLRQEVRTISSEDSIILDKILYNGSHSGDIIELKLLNALEEEITSIISSDSLSKELEAFLRDLQQLIGSSRKQKNPIVFV